LMPGADFDAEIVKANRFLRKMISD